MALLTEFDYTPLQWAVVSVITLLLYGISNAVYQLYLSPLAKFPGPRVAAVTRLYEVYHDVWRRGQYTFEIQKMHEEYGIDINQGPIIRISPYELHINDPDYYQELYSRSAPRDKWAYFVGMFGLPLSTFSTTAHAHHRRRRAALNPFFSKQKIARLEHTIAGKVDKLCSRVEEYRRSGLPLPLRLLFISQTTDVITQYAFGRSWGHLEHPELSPAWNETVKKSAELGVVFKHFPWMYRVLERLPDRVAAMLDPGLVSLFELQRGLREQIGEVMEGKEDRESFLVDGMPTVFHQLLNSELPPEELSLQRLWQEGQIIVGAGAETTANTLALTTFHLLDNPEKVQRLREELRSVMPDENVMPKWQVLEQLPYLSAIINEGLRLSYGVSTRLPRIAPNQVLRFHDWTIPAGTPVGMTSVLMHHNERIFPSSHTFMPERWLVPQDPSEPPLDRYMVSFTKGSRQCVGMNLARAQIYLTLAAVFGRFELQLYETTKKDVELKHDLFLPHPDFSSKGVRVLVV